MLCSAVPPCRTITFDGEQFAGAFAAPAVAGFPVGLASGAELDELEFEVAWPEAAGVLLQLEAITLFLCRRFLLAGGL